MKVLGLLSGGKDSVAAIDLVRQRGWEVVGACSLHVVGEDSMMFHKPNIALAPLIAEAMGLRAFVAETEGVAEAEIDDLAGLLAGARRATGAEGVTAGAMASEYQRVRIERAAHDVGLKTFAPLWRKDPVAHLGMLAAGGYDVRFSSVSAEGLGQEWLGAPLDAAHLERLLELSARHRFHPAGEGGEYETLVLDGPGFLRRVEVLDAAPRWDGSRGEWVVLEAELREKG